MIAREGTVYSRRPAEATFLIISSASSSEGFSPLPTIRMTIRLTADFPPVSIYGYMVALLCKNCAPVWYSLCSPWLGDQFPSSRGPPSTSNKQTASEPLRLEPMEGCV